MTKNEYIIKNETTNAVINTAQDIPELYYILCAMSTPDTMQMNLRIEYGGICVACHETADTLAEEYRGEAMEAQSTADIVDEYEAELSERINADSEWE